MQPSSATPECFRPKGRPDHCAPCMAQRAAWLRIAMGRCADVRAGRATIVDVLEARDNARAWTELAQEDPR